MSPTPKPFDRPARLPRVYIWVGIMVVTMGFLVTTVQTWHSDGNRVVGVTLIVLGVLCMGYGKAPVHGSDGARVMPEARSSAH